MQGREKDAKVGRAAMLAKANFPVPMPYIDHDIIATIEDIGWCQSSGMGPVPLSAVEVSAWCGLMQDSLTPWEAWMIRRMSDAFCAGVSAERAPYEPLAVRMALASASFMAGT